LKDHGKQVIYDAEHAFDGYKDAAEYAMASWQAAERAGADCIVLCDTNGGCLPHEISDIVSSARGKLSARIGIHTHNDIGLGAANGLAGIAAGATQIQGTINGYGERTGNCNLITVIPLLQLKLKHKVLPETAMPQLKELSDFVDEIANVRHDPRQPWVGQTAFAHKGGMHVHAIDRVARSYEHVNPEAVGNQRRVLVSDMSGRTNILMKAAELGFNLESDAPETRAITAEVKRLEGEGYEYEAAEGSLALLIRRCLKHKESPFKIEGYHVSVRRERSISVCQASVKVQVEGVSEHTIAEGDGPVNALDGALRRALIQFFPQLKEVQLEDYKVRILDSRSGTSARTRVLIESTDGKEEWGTVGVHDNIIEASVQALSDSFEYRLSRK
jgi:2-isopropylmalate synthase